MLWNLFIRFYFTPENIIGIIIDLSLSAGLCLMFYELGEKWWKSLIPIYGTYLLYKNVYEKAKWLFMIQIIFELVQGRMRSIIRKHVVGSLFYSIKNYFQTRHFDADIDIPLMLTCVIILGICMFIVFIMTRITYWKLCSKLNLSIAFKVCSLVIPGLIFIAAYIYIEEFVKKKDIEKRV